jgi:PhoH-like ATPase
MVEMPISTEKMAKFRADEELALNGGKTYFPNEYCTLIDESNPKKTALTKVDATGTKLIPIIDSREGVWGIKPRNREQNFALDALLDDRVKLVTLMGKAGTGKTLLAMAAGLKKTVLDREFRRLVVARPTITMGKELGFLPGSLEEKLAPWMQPIHDALEMLSDLNMGHDHRRAADLMRSGSIVVEALSYIRGRSIANQFMVIDESQNLTRWRPRPSSPAWVTAPRSFSPAIPIKLTIPTWIPPRTDSITSSAGSATRRSLPTSSCRRASAPNWRNSRRIFCKQATGLAG